MIKRNIPNCITLLNLLCGCMAIVSTLNGNLERTFYLIIAAMVFDFCDGFAARALKAYSELGKQLDSLADLVSFGVVPSLILYVLGLEHVGFIVALTSALRLAKFNIDPRQTDSFIGLPTPANALLFISIGYIAYIEPNSTIGTWFNNSTILTAITLIFSALLVCELPMFSLKFKDFSVKKSGLIYIFLLISLVSFIIFKIIALPFIICGYVFISTIKWLICK